MKWNVVLLIVVVIVVGFFVYKLIPFTYTPNIPPLLEISQDELNALDAKSKQANLTEQEKLEILTRQDEIYLLLKEFFGKDIRTN